MTSLPVSVVVVSRGRPDALKRCLLGLSQVQYTPFEIVVVADPAGLAAARSMAFHKDLKLVPYDVANISAARNLGLIQSAGEIVAFIDDDAVPEPQWLFHLTAPAGQSDVAAMGGFVRGRNGISFQYRARSLDALGIAHPLEVHDSRATVLHPPNGRAIKTEGTNMALRRSVLIDLGGFDPAFHYFLDETDLNMRLAKAGHATAIVPLAEVHHGFAANAMRTQTRVPTDLFDIGASWAVFQRKHIADSAHKEHWAGLRTSERQRLLRHMHSGALEPRDVRRLMGRLDAGFEEGRARPFGQSTLPAHPTTPFLPFPSEPRKAVYLSTRPVRLKQDLAAAAERVKQGEIVSLLCLSPSALYHHLAFTTEGVWLQKGGIWGRSKRTGRLIQPITRKRRIEKERARITLQRGLDADRQETKG